MTRLATPQVDEARSGWDRFASFMTEPLGSFLRLRGCEPIQQQPLRPVVRHTSDEMLHCEPDEHAPDRALAMCVVARGDLSDQSRVKAVYRMCNRLFDSGSQRVVLDLTDAGSIDTKMVGALVVLQRRALQEHVQFRVRCSDAMRHWLAFCRINSIIEPAR